MLFLLKNILYKIYNHDFTNLESIISVKEMNEIFKETIHFELNGVK